MRNLLPVYVAAAALSANPCAAYAQCQLHFMTPQDGKLTIGKTTVSLGQPDSKDQPTSWEGPIKAGQCTFDPGVIEQPIAMTPRGWLYIPSYSGSERMVTLYDTSTCSIRWQSKTFAGTLELTARELRLGDTSIPMNNACAPQAGLFATQRPISLR